MTKQLHKLAHEIQAAILRDGGPPRDTPAVLTDAWASLQRWYEAGERVWRIEPTVETPELPSDLVLATAPVQEPGICYTGPERGDWIVVARHAAEQVIVVYGDKTFAFSTPVLTYLTATESGGIASGRVNLDDLPTWGDMYLMAGKTRQANGSERWLHQDEIATEEERFHRALRHWYGARGIVI